MIKKFIDRLLGKPAGGPPLGKRREIAAEEHRIDPSLLDERAVKVVRTLQEAGHQAYIVGGAVRDLLCSRRPKDFDVATDATPEQVKALFRRAFIIGRRFRIVHVVHGRGRDHEVIEVSTFRAYLEAAAADQVEGNEKTSKAELVGKSHVVDASGRVLRDNVWGPQVEDAARRDFTVNAMYYDPTTQTVVDYHGGLKDAQRRVLRMIGDPATRYREDPVRLLRVVRFAAKLGFDIEAKTRAAMAQTVPLLAAVPTSRLFDEMIKLLQTGHALASLEQIKAHGLHRGVFPVLDAVLDERKPNPKRDEFVRLALTDTDKRVQEDRPVAPSFLLACLLWHEVLERWNRLKAEGESVTPALALAIDQVFDARIGDISGRGKLAADMREIWMMQPRFDRRVGATPFSLVEQPRFRAGFDFLRLRADTGEAPTELADWWEDFSLGSAEERDGLVQAAREAQTQTRKPAKGGGRVHRLPKEPAGEAAAAAETVATGDEPALAEEGDGAPAARKRRRRRRKPAGAEGAGPADGA